MKNLEEEKILLVKNPFTNKMINVYAMLEFLNRNNYSNKGEGGKEGFEIIDSAIRTLVVNYGEDENIEELKMNTINLYELRKAFSKMNEIEV